jgi:hypothetical protein
MWQNEYFAATIYGRSKTGFKVQFDDGDKATVPLQRMRILELKPGEPVRDGTGSTVDLLVQVPFDGTTDEVQVLDSSSEPTTIPIRSLVVPPAVIEQRFGRRMLNAGDLNTRFPLVAPARNTAAAAATATDDDRLPFENQIFLISRGETRLSTDSVKKQILQNGGTVIDAWQDLFTIHKASYELKTELVPFIIYMGDKNVMPIKVMVALATGIPILTKKYVEDTLDATQDADWRCYLMPAGESAYMHQKNSRVLWVSQMVDPNWGEESWVAKDARGIRQAFKGLNVLFVEPTTAKHEEIKVS